MKAFFIFKDGKLIGSPIGYTTPKGAEKSLVGCEDWHRLHDQYAKYNAKENLSQELIDSGLFSRSYNGKTWLFEREKWSRKIWHPYMKKHYDIVEKEFDVVFKD